jgi:hypothetical protein
MNREADSHAMLTPHSSSRHRGQSPQGTLTFAEAKRSDRTYADLAVVAREAPRMILVVDRRIQPPAACHTHECVTATPAHRAHASGAQRAIADPHGKASPIGRTGVMLWYWQYQRTISILPFLRLQVCIH